MWDLPELQRGEAAGAQSPQQQRCARSSRVVLSPQPLPAQPGLQQPRLRDQSRKPTGGSEKPKTSQPYSKPSIQALGVAAKGSYSMGFPKS